MRNTAERNAGKHRKNSAQVTIAKVGYHTEIDEYELIFCEVIADAKFVSRQMAKSLSADQDFLETTIKAMVDHPDEVKITRTVDEMGVLLTLKVNAEDMGQIIGRQGSTAKAIRTLLRVIGMKNNARVNFKIEEPEGGQARPSRRGASAGKEVASLEEDLQL